MLSELEQVVASAPDRPDVGGPDHPMRTVTRELAAGDGWDRDRAAHVAALFDGLAPGWAARVAGEGEVAVGDALRRGGVPSGGRCAEIGSGTGSLTGTLAAVFDAVLCVDLSWGMLVHAPAGPGRRIHGDAAALPFATGSMDAVALVNAFLFPAEMDRVLHRGGCLVWVSSLADQTPIYLPPAEVLDALPGAWDGVTAHAGWGQWLVARRATSAR